MIERLTHAGGIVYRLRGARPEYLLVGPSKEKPNEWILPKGHIKEGETPEQAATREVKEETGVTARIESPIGAIQFATGQNMVRSMFYLMNCISEDESVEQRRRSWFSYEDAVANATHPETKALLKKAAARVEAGPTAGSSPS